MLTLYIYFLFHGIQKYVANSDECRHDIGTLSVYSVWILGCGLDGSHLFRTLPSPSLYYKYVPNVPVVMDGLSHLFPFMTLFTVR